MPTLVLIDTQVAFHEPVWGVRNNPDAEANLESLLRGWRAAGQPVMHVRHDSADHASPLSPTRPGNGVMEALRETAAEPVLRKSVNSGFIGTSLEADLRAAGQTAIVVAGITTDHCVSTTVRMAANLGFAVTLASDACFTFARVGHGGETIPAETVHAVHLASLDGEFAAVRATADILADLVGTG